MDYLHKNSDLGQSRRRDAPHQAPGEVTGERASTIYRDKLTGKKVDVTLERLRRQEEKNVEESIMAKHMEWGRGLVQRRDKQKLLQELEEERNRPLAIYYDDRDLNESLKKRARWGDPLVNSSKPSGHERQSELPRSRQNDTIHCERKTYQGPVPPPNRFNIMPGYRWDGVDRSNGYENRYFELMAAKLASKEEAYRWSVEDM
jgi:pre-mRNA-splicing factor CWC26